MLSHQAPEELTLEEVVQLIHFYTHERDPRQHLLELSNIYLRYGELLANEGRIDKAIEQLEQAYFSNLQNTHALEKLIKVQPREDHRKVLTDYYEKAKGAFTSQDFKFEERMTGIEHPYAYWLMSTNFAYRENYKAALETLTKYLESTEIEFPRRILATFLMGTCFARTKDDLNAAAFFAEALRMHGGNFRFDKEETMFVSVLVCLSKLHHLPANPLTDVDKAVKQLSIFTRANKLGLALKTINSIIATLPKNSGAYYGRAEIIASMNKKDMNDRAVTMILADLSLAIWLQRSGVDQSEGVDVRHYYYKRKLLFLEQQRFAESLEDHRMHLSLTIPADRLKANIDYAKRIKEYGRTFEKKQPMIAISYIELASVIHPEKSTDILLQQMKESVREEKTQELQEMKIATTPKASKQEIKLSKQERKRQLQQAQEEKAQAEALQKQAVQEQQAQLQQAKALRRAEKAKEKKQREQEKKHLKHEQKLQAERQAMQQLTFALPDEVVKFLQELTFAGAKHAYVTGGYARDLISGKANLGNSIDIVTDSNGLTLLNRYQDARPARLIPGLFHLTLGAYRLSILFNAELADNLLVDANKRDFLCNALYLTAEGKIVDPTLKAYKQLQSKMIHSVNDAAAAIAQDATLILRAIYLMHKTGFSLSETLQEAMRQHLHLLANAPSVAVSVILGKMFADHPVENLKTLVEWRILGIMFPKSAANICLHQDYLARLLLTVESRYPVNEFYVALLVLGTSCALAELTAVALRDKHENVFFRNHFANYLYFDELLASELISNPVTTLLVEREALVQCADEEAIALCEAEQPYLDTAKYFEQAISFLVNNPCGFFAGGPNVEPESETPFLGFQP